MESEMCIRDSPNNIEVVHGRWSKWNAIVKLADMIGVRQEEIMAVGDSNNDYEMLLNAGYSVAMGNACDRVKDVYKRQQLFLILKSYYL